MASLGTLFLAGSVAVTSIVGSSRQGAAQAGANIQRRALGYPSRSRKNFS